MGSRSTTLAGAILVALTPFAASCSAESKAFDSAKVVITLTRSACFGPCPVYKVVIHGTGNVIFTTDTAPIDPVDAVHRRFAQSDGVLLPGTHEDQIAPETVAVLVGQFQTANFWRLSRSYRAPITDSPTYSLTLDTSEGRRKTVIDYVGGEAGMPKIVTTLEEAVDHAAGTDRWISGSPALIPWLERSGFDFHSAHASELAVAGEWGAAAEATVAALIDRGAPLDNVATTKGSSPISEIHNPQVAGMMLLEGAIRRGHSSVFRRLVTGGWLDRLGKERTAELFAQNAAGCSPSMVDAVAEAGVDIDLSAPKVLDVGPSEPQGKSALAELANSYSCKDDEGSRVKAAGKLLALGANPNHRDSLGRTPLYGVENIDLLNLLLAHGADATAKSSDGQSMVFGSWTDAIVLRLLEAGASPRGRYDIDGNKTLAEEAKGRNMSKVAKWLHDHPQAMLR